MDKSDLRREILVELFNVGVGKAAALLSEITNQKILLHIPKIETYSLNDQVDLARLRGVYPFSGTLMVSSITFHDQLSGKANLIFPADKVRTLINLCLGENEPVENQDFTDIDLDTIKEIGNIVLNSIVGQFANSLNLPIYYSIPKVQLYNDTDSEDGIKEAKKIYLLILSVTFNINGTEIVGAIRIELSLQSMSRLLASIDRIGDQVNE